LRYTESRQFRPNYQEMSDNVHVYGVDCFNYLVVR